MSTEKIKSKLSTKLANDEYCKLALDQLLNEIPYEEMSLLGKISFNSLLKRSLRTRQKFNSFNFFSRFSKVRHYIITKYAY